MCTRDALGVAARAKLYEYVSANELTKADVVTIVSSQRRDGHKSLFGYQNECIQSHAGQ